MQSKKLLWRWLKIILLLYGLIGIALYYLQDVFLFHPQRLARDHVFKFKHRFKEINLPVNATDTISAVHFFSTQSPVKGMVVYYHGNMNNIEHYEPYVAVFLQKGYDVLMGDYPGYGKTSGSQTEKKMNEQARIIYTYAISKFSADSLVIYGKSLGTGIATYVASYEKAKALVLETPYYSISSLFRHYAFIYPVESMSKYKIPLHQYLTEVKMPVIIFHGTGDDVIPYKNAKRLLPLLKRDDQFITIENGGHNTLTASAAYKKKIDELLP
ncbi:MAG: alpha/beta fold hydrolase [Ferruginibacter sp.]